MGTPTQHNKVVKGQKPLPIQVGPTTKSNATDTPSSGRHSNVGQAAISSATDAPTKSALSVGPAAKGSATDAEERYAGTMERSDPA